jgi:hypothetical protein
MLFAFLPQFLKYFSENCFARAIKSWISGVPETERTATAWVGLTEHALDIIAEPMMFAREQNV